MCMTLIMWAALVRGRGRYSIRGGGRYPQGRHVRVQHADGSLAGYMAVSGTRLYGPQHSAVRIDQLLAAQPESILLSEGANRLHTLSKADTLSSRAKVCSTMYTQQSRYPYTGKTRLAVRQMTEAKAVAEQIGSLDEL